MFEFGLIKPNNEISIREGFNRFLNTVFENYYRKAEASVALRLRELREQLENSLDSVTMDDDTHDLIMERLLKNRADEILKKVESYPKRKSDRHRDKALKTRIDPTFTFTLNRENYEYLTSEDSECEEEKYYTGRSGRRKYIKGVIEEYTRLPHAERESIYFSSTIDRINYCISKKRSLIVNTAHSVYRVYPYEIRQDTQATTNYLVGYCEKMNPKEERRTCSFKIAALKSIRDGINRNQITADEIDALEEEIKAKGVAFIMNDEANIIVKLTNDGIFKYRRIHNLRPTKSREITDLKQLRDFGGIDNMSLIEKKLAEKQEGEGVYLFQCTKSQARFYFIRFEADAEILSPLSLRREFVDIYKSVLDSYEKNPCPDEEKGENA